MLGTVDGDEAPDAPSSRELSQHEQLASLEAVLLVTHRHRQVTVVRRSEGTWLERDFRPGERVELDPGVSFDVAALYAVVDPSAIP